jgi:4-hydroxy-3-methylbut-2-enyl diphosphate reductase
LGPIIHNPQEVERLNKKGVKILQNYKKVKNGYVILRTHGIPSDLYKELKNQKDIVILDAVCPFVKKAQNIVEKLNNDQKSKSKTIVIVGEKRHPEIAALVSYGGKKCVVIEDVKAALSFRSASPIINIVSQTTQTHEKFDSIVKVLKKQYKVKVHDTICAATVDRQNAAEKLAKNVDLMLVIGGKNSGNTARLAQICSQNTRTYHIEKSSDIRKSWFKDVTSVGLTAGASTPDWIIKKVERRVRENNRGSNLK